MGLKDLLRSITGREEGPERGTRGQREAPRRADDPTIRIASPADSGQAPPPSGGAPAGGSPPDPSATPPAPAPPQAPPPPAQTGQAPAPPAPPQAPPQSAPPSPAPQPGPPARSSLTEAPTQYMAVPRLEQGRVVGVLVGVDGELDGQVYTLHGGENKLGRGPDCDAKLLDERISREHATVIFEDGMFAIAPLTDKNATYVNEEPTEGSELADGDLIRMGSSLFRFRTIEGP